MFQKKFSQLKNYVEDRLYKPKNHRPHFPGKWNEREIKESPTVCTKKRKSAICLHDEFNLDFKLILDQYLIFYTYHFIFAEEMFYGHIGFLVILSKGDAKYLTNQLKSNRDLDFKTSDYELYKQIGSGSFGTVFIAKSLKRNKLVALKKICLKKNPQSENISLMIEKEASLLAASSSPFIVKLLDAFVVEQGTKQGAYLVYEYAAGGDLADMIRRIHKKQQASMMVRNFHLGEFPGYLKSNKLIVDAARYFGAQLLLGIKALHERDIIHQDLKPNNILINHKGILKIADFGLVKRFRWFQYNARSEFITNFGLNKRRKKDNTSLYIGGTLNYMEPELRVNFINDKEKTKDFEGDFNLTYKADYFAIGLIIFEIFFGFGYGIIDDYFKLCGEKVYKILQSMPMLLHALWYFEKYLTASQMTEVKYFLPSAFKGYLSNKKQRYDVFKLLKSTISSRENRWKDYTFEVDVLRDGKIQKDFIVSIEKLQSRIELFRTVDFQKLNRLENIPKDLTIFISTLCKREINVEITNSVLEMNKNDADNYADRLNYEFPFFKYNLPNESPNLNSSLDKVVTIKDNRKHTEVSNFIFGEPFGDLMPLLLSDQFIIK